MSIRAADCGDDVWVVLECAAAERPEHDLMVSSEFPCDGLPRNSELKEEKKDRRAPPSFE